MYSHSSVVIHSHYQLFALSHAECCPLNLQVFIDFAKDQADPDGTDAGPDVTSDSSDTCSQASTISSIY